jgi:hypothetical protein
MTLICRAIVVPPAVAALRAAPVNWSSPDSLAHYSKKQNCTTHTLILPLQRPMILGSINLNMTFSIKSPMRIIESNPAKTSGILSRFFASKIHL